MRDWKWRVTMRAWTTGTLKGTTRLGFTGMLTITRMLKDDRVRGHQEKSIFQFKDLSDRMG